MGTTYKIHLDSINKTIEYNNAIEEENINDIDLTLLSEIDLMILLRLSVGSAENIITFELENREEENEQ